MNTLLVHIYSSLPFQLLVTVCPQLPRWQFISMRSNITATWCVFRQQPGLPTPIKPWTNVESSWLRSVWELDVKFCQIELLLCWILSYTQGKGYGILGVIRSIFTVCFLSFSCLQTRWWQEDRWTTCPGGHRKRQNHQGMETSQIRYVYE